MALKLYMSILLTTCIFHVCTPRQEPTKHTHQPTSHFDHKQSALLPNLLADIHTQKAATDNLAVEQAWLRYAVDGLSNSTHDIREAVTKLDKVATLFLEIQDDHERRLSALEEFIRNSQPTKTPRRRPRKDYMYVHDMQRPMNTQPAVAKGGPYYQDMSVRGGVGGRDHNQCGCFSQKDRSELEAHQHKLDSTLEMLRFIGDNINRLNSSNTDIIVALEKQGSYIDNLAMDMEYMKDNVIKNRRRVRAQDGKLKAFSKEVNVLLEDCKNMGDSLLERVDGMEQIVFALSQRSFNPDSDRRHF